MLAKFVCEAEKLPYLLEFCMHSCAALPLVWKQKETQLAPSCFGDFDESSSEDEENTLVDHVNERDDVACVIRRSPPSVVAHIYPVHLLETGKTYPSFWDMLRFSWTSDRVSKWHRQIFTNPEYPDRPFDSVKNMLCLVPGVHRMWNNGNFALKPVG
ncbi:hypothetical protein ASPWEDRAFT_24618 [Aspergillus wentii DTO 134E9]|uniref:HNH nuclease domain-containing protein n=1 Tax=Aspergillus wentii DTO 134E9 TaxID=1073089 RepID=A0A1L9RUX0_ASPWE|nr:uncharacterized protein ASPWEDRAFT_24618 [Aspergillus wentii DTO 134E9]OJJ38715.1 hypothetical protein ASPWEDRAFT_24618 [Aspergillus wentii DTO 134E9]